MMNKKMGRIGVILGGPSSEREVSLKSGRAVYDALASLGLDVVCIDPMDTASVKSDILKTAIDVAFIALHGRFGEDGTIQAILEEMDIPYTGSGPQASRLALDKFMSRKIFEKNSIPVPKYSLIEKGDEAKAIADKFSLPFVVKPVNEGSSIGLSIVEKSNYITSAIDLAFRYDNEILIEEYIPGEDITVGILDDEPLPVIHIKPKAKFYNFKAKYTPGMTEYVVPADFPEEITKEAQALGGLAHNLLGCRNFSRVDMMVDRRSGKVIVLEVNTIPGLTATSLLPKAAKACGIDFAQMCLKMVESALVAV